MPIRLSGINSGLDTDALIKELVSAYSLKTEKYEKQKTKVEWKKEAWQGLNTKIYGLYTNISNLRFDTAYNLKKTSVSDATKVSVTASSNAVTGTQKLNILQTAQASYITGEKLNSDVTAKSTLGDLGYDGEATTIEVRKNDGSIHEINVSKDTKISDVVKQLNDAGLNASFDENNKRFFVSAKESGAANDFSLCSTDEESQSVLELIGMDSSIFEKKDGKIVFSSAGAAYQEAIDLRDAAALANKDISTYLKDLLDGYKKAISDEEANITTAQDTIDEYNALVKQRDVRAAFDEVSTSLEEKGFTIESEDLEKMIKDLYSKDKEITEEDVTKYLEENKDTISLPEGKTAKELADALNENKEKLATVANYEDGVPSMSLTDLESAIEGKKTDYENAIAAKDAANKEIARIKSQDFYELTELSEEDLNAKITNYEDTVKEAEKLLANPSVSEGGAIKVVGQDAIIKLNGAEFTSSTNSFSINGLTIDAHNTTGEGDANAISISTSVDNQGIYDKIKDFLSQYNSVINEITKLYNADSAKGYEPLTDEERDAMSETEIEKWEDKIKGAILRRDNSLGGVMNAMINSMSQSFEVNGQRLSLGSFGISTLGFLNAAENEQYAFHIDGDEDDANTSGKTNKLMAAIQENPDQIIDFMKQLTSNLYKAVDDKMKSTELSSVYKVYNDKEIDKEIKSIEELIEKWEDKVTAEEDRYYKQFSQMEVALSKLQSQTNSLAGLLGM